MCKPHYCNQDFSPLAKGGYFIGIWQNGQNGDLISNEKPFICPSDGHFGDPNDCSKFYKCAHGTTIPEFCPSTLLWNQGKFCIFLSFLFAKFVLGTYTMATFGIFCPKSICISILRSNE